LIIAPHFDGIGFETTSGRITMPLSSCFLFSRLSEPQLERVLAISREQKIKKEQWLFREDQEAQNFYLIKDGAIELLTVVDERIEIPIAMVRTNNGCIGIGALVQPFRYSLSSRAAQDSNLLVFRRADLEALKQEDPGLVCIMMNNLAQKLLARLKETRQELKIHFMNLVRSATF
jgi:CRP-like cAMP-binding protein